ncbi:MAG: amidohydrolase family protein [Oscillospiraceae bacterium]|nr:amidohydrolase family protein [Oscillospiraceae bacterium]
MKTRTAIKNAVLVMRDHLIPDGVLLVEDGKICAFGDRKRLPVPDGAMVIDAGGAFLGPGLVDIHAHTGGGVFFRDDPIAASRHHLKHGATTVMPALYFSMNAKEYVEAINVLRKAMESRDCINIGGLYMEGPYLNPKFGADRTSIPWQGPVASADYAPMVDAARDIARVWALAPERENILEFVRDVRGKNPDAVFAVAHSEASPYEIEALIPYGLCIGTHHTNSTGNGPSYSECRGVCVDEAVNYNREIYAELICDNMGIHVNPYMLRLVRKIKGDDRIILISDANADDGPVPRGYEDATEINFDHSGEISGSKLTLNIACRNMMKHTGASIVDVFKFASYNPAKAVGFRDRGELAVGKRADLILVDYNMNVKTVILKGEPR